jgi:hypothetical protein
MTRRFGRDVRRFIPAGGEAGGRKREAAPYPVEVCRAGQRGVQAEGEQNESHAPRSRADYRPTLSPKSQPESLPLGEINYRKFNHRRGRTVKLLTALPAQPARPG